MTQPQPPAPQVIYVERPPSHTMAVFAWITALFTLLWLPFSGTPFALLTVIAWLGAVGLTVASFRTSRRSPHWIAAASVLTLSTALFVLHFATTIGDY